MKAFFKLPVLLLLVITATALCGCPPLDYKVFVRNITSDTARLTLLYKSNDTVPSETLSARAAFEILPVRKKNLEVMNERVPASVNARHVTLLVPPKSTVYVSDVLQSLHRFGAEYLMIERAGHLDTVKSNFHYKGFSKKPDPSYNYLYNTLVYYDIK
ncbi:hypothetical protein [Sediminibacterium ginsengisoli]|nr:hypothetical protein [Sediminibacterium ginsengisoli]